MRRTPWSLLAPGHGRWDLVIPPPDTTEVDTEPLIAALSSPA
jgi:hypothetical protein